MKNIGLDKMEVKAIFRRTFTSRSVSLESYKLDCMADAVGQVIEENNRKLLEELEITLTKEGLSNGRLTNRFESKQNSFIFE